MNNYRDLENIEDLLQSFDTAARGIEFKYRGTVLGQVIDGLNKSGSIDLNIEHARQALVRLTAQWTRAVDGLPEGDKKMDWLIVRPNSQPVVLYGNTGDQVADILTELWPDKDTAYQPITGPNNG